MAKEPGKGFDYATQRHNAKSRESTFSPGRLARLCIPQPANGLEMQFFFSSVELR